MRILVFGSLNIDHTYRVSHLVRAGETLASDGYQKSEGGKGLNQAVALAKAGMDVYMAGAIGPDGTFLLDALRAANVNTDLVKTLHCATGHAMIQVDEDGANSIILHSGANEQITLSMIDETLSHFAAGDWVLLQNEIAHVDEIIVRAKQRGLTVALNPSPASANIRLWRLELVDLLILNEVEGKDLTGESEPVDIISSIHVRYSKRCKILLTLGAQGAIYVDENGALIERAVPVTPVDTTAAGDTFTGYFIAQYARDKNVRAALRCATVASALTIQRQGASRSIPDQREVIETMHKIEA